MFAASKTDSVSDGGYQISRSLRFNRGDSPYLNRSPTATGSRTTFTLSLWVKLGNLTTGSDSVIWASGNASTGNPLTFLWKTFSTNYYFNLTGGTTEISTTAVYRDPSAWYHIVLAIDTTQATDTNRIKLYVNGVQVTAFATANYPAQNFTYDINTSSYPAYFGCLFAGGFIRFWEGYQTEINFIDGTQLTPSSFGETNAQTGVWQPKAYSGSYGTNGFYLNFSDNSNTTAATLGKDYSGNGNNWTPNNFSVSAGAGNDSMVDVPTPYGVDTGAGGTVRGNYATFNPLTTSRTISNGNLYTEVNGGGGSNVPISLSMALPTTGKWYWEITAGGPAGGGNGGWDWGIVASSTPNFRLANLLVAGTTGCYGVNGNSGTLVANATTAVAGYISGGIANGDVAQIAYDADTGKLWLGKNNTWGSNGGVGNPAAGTNAGITSLSGEFIPVFEYASDSGTISATLNTGQRAFAYTAPSGFKALCTQNLPTPTIGATSATLAGKYFNPVLYTGNGGTQSVTGVGFQPDFTWVKSRTSTNGNGFEDAIRGAGLTLESNSTAAEVNYSAYFTAFTSDGFNMALGGGFFNSNGQNYVAWNWRASNATAVTNTSGSITSTVSANTTSGFSIVTYTGNSVSGATVGHGLGVAPRMIIVKGRAGTYGADHWAVYHASLGATQILNLNLTSAAVTSPYPWNDTAPTSTVWSNGSGAQVNFTGTTYVAYCFAQIAGYSAFGSYTGNGSTDGPFVFTGFRPAFVLTKRTDSTGDWQLMDSSRDTYNVANKALFPNTTDLETTGYSKDFLSNGFKIRDSGASLNASGGTYIYMAFASNPFKYSLAR